MKMKDAVVENCLHLIELSKMLSIPIIVTEQYPKGLGPTVEPLRNALSDYRPVEKLTFSCCDEPSFLDAIRNLHSKTLIVTGMETHICILQTSIGLVSGRISLILSRQATAGSEPKFFIRLKDRCKNQSS